MAWCEANGVDYVFGLARNTRLLAEIDAELAAGRRRSAPRPAQPARRVRGLHATRRCESWSRERRVVAKAEHLAKGANPRFVVTSLSSEDRRGQDLYTRGSTAAAARWRTGSRSSSCTCSPTAPAATMRANQVRLWFSSIAYVLLRSAAADRPAGHAARQRHVRHHPSEAAEDRCPGPHQRAPHQGGHGFSLPLPERVPPRLPPPASRRLLTVPHTRDTPARRGVRFRTSENSPSTATTGARLQSHRLLRLSRPAARSCYGV